MLKLTSVGILPKILLEGIKVVNFLKGNLEDEGYFQLHDNRLLIIEEDNPLCGGAAPSVLEFVRQ